MNSSGDEEIPAEEQPLEGQELPEAVQGELPAEALAELDPDLGADLDPSLSVDEMLTAAIAEEGAPATPVEPEQVAADHGNAPSFQLAFPALSAEQRIALIKLFQPLQLPESHWAGPAPMVSQLTEYQALHFLQAARGLGLQAQCSVNVPRPEPSEEELALGDLSAVTEDGGAPVVESAPSVVLPKGEKDVMLCSPSRLPQSRIVESFGIVIAHRSIARRLFREEEMKEKLERELQNAMAGRSPPLASSHLQQVMRELFLDLRKSALAQGANSVLGVKLEAFPESSSTDPLLEQLRLVAFGTAAVVEKA